MNNAKQVGTIWPAASRIKPQWRVVGLYKSDSGCFGIFKSLVRADCRSSAKSEAIDYHRRMRRNNITITQCSEVVK